jgi:hypothetical protein
VDNKKVSTVWLGCDLEQILHPNDPPMIFGTCILLDGEETQYDTETEATEGHHKIVQRLKTKQ